jgi:hypothetical protein
MSRGDTGSHQESLKNKGNFCDMRDKKMTGFWEPTSSKTIAFSVI